MSEQRARLYFMCGKMAAGKSTLARELARTNDSVLLVLDDFFDALYPGEVRSIPDFIRCAARLRNALSPHIRDLLSRGVPVVLDFPGNTRTQRQWFRELIEGTGVEHELHFIDAPDDLCKRQLSQRSESLPAGAAWTTDAEFDALTAYFEPPAAEEKFNVVRHERAWTHEHEEVAGFIAKYTPELGRTLEACRARMHVLVPRGYELVYDNYNALVFGYGPSEKSSEAPLSLAAYPRWVTLCFLQGAALDDPLRLLAGSGAQVRSVRLGTAADLDKPEILALMKQAMQPWAAGFSAAPPIKTVVKSVSARQRARQP